MKISNKEQFERVSSEFDLLITFFRCQKDERDSPFYYFLNCEENRELIGNFCPICSEYQIRMLIALYNRHENKYFLKEKDPDVEFFSNGILESVDESVNYIIDNMLLDKRCFNELVRRMIAFADSIYDIGEYIIDDQEAPIYIFVGRFFRFIYPLEKRALFSDWLTELSEYIEQKYLVIFSTTLRLIMKQLQLTDSDREASTVIIARLRQGLKKV